MMKLKIMILSVLFAQQAAFACLAGQTKFLEIDDDNHSNAYRSGCLNASMKLEGIVKHIENGTKKVLQTDSYKDGLLDGLITVYELDISGERFVASKRQMSQGKCIEIIDYYYNGVVKAEWIIGESYTEYFPSGKIKTKGEYREKPSEKKYNEKGELIYQKTMDKFGRVTDIFQGTFNKCSTKYRFATNDKPASIVDYLNKNGELVARVPYPFTGVIYTADPVLTAIENTLTTNTKFHQHFQTLNWVGGFFDKEMNIYSCSVRHMVAGGETTYDISTIGREKTVFTFRTPNEPSNMISVNTTAQIRNGFLQDTSCIEAELDAACARSMEK